MGIILRTLYNTLKIVMAKLVPSHLFRPLIIEPVAATDGSDQHRCTQTIEQRYYASGG